MLTRDTRHKHSEIQKGKEKRYTRETPRSLMQALLGYPKPSCLFLEAAGKDSVACLPELLGHPPPLTHVSSHLQSQQ